MKKLKYLVYFLMVATLKVSAQNVPDTGAVIREFNKVMSFAIRPYLHFSSLISMRSGPMVDQETNISLLHNEFYKIDDELYYGNEREELYLQDSLMIRINHLRKTIQLNKIDLATKKKMDILPLKKMDAQKLLREQYTIAEISEKEDTGQILIRSREKRGVQGFTSSEMKIRYARGSHLPVLMEITMKVRQPESEQIKEIYRSRGFDIGKMMLEMGGEKSLEITETASISFGPIGMTKENAMTMPLWEEKITYDDQLKRFSGKGQCEGYEVIKTF
ncbi:hypothetical protein ACX0G9_08540 [Flavitalea flava]